MSPKRPRRSPSRAFSCGCSTDRDTPTQIVSALVTYVLPAVAVALGAVDLGEPITAAMLIGTGIVLMGVAIACRSTTPATQAA
jgi:drug/metabolite transporter (DMT)-like permease